MKLGELLDCEPRTWDEGVARSGRLRLSDGRRHGGLEEVLIWIEAEIQFWYKGDFVVWQRGGWGLVW